MSNYYFPCNSLFILSLCNSDVDQVKRICNKGVKQLLKCVLKLEDDTDVYLKLLECGLNDLNGKELLTV